MEQHLLPKFCNLVWCVTKFHGSFCSCPALGSKWHLDFWTTHSKNVSNTKSHYTIPSHLPHLFLVYIINKTYMWQWLGNFGSLISPALSISQENFFDMAYKDFHQTDLIRFKALCWGYLSTKGVNCDRPGGKRDLICHCKCFFSKTIQWEYCQLLKISYTVHIWFFLLLLGEKLIFFIDVPHLELTLGSESPRYHDRNCL